jgi:hypothetical protein
LITVTGKVIVPVLSSTKKQGSPQRIFTLVSRPDSDVVSAVLRPGKIDLHRYRLTRVLPDYPMPIRCGVNIQVADDIRAGWNH